jgi:uncharacterized protein YidB (DUF937 family)
MSLLNDILGTFGGASGAKPDLGQLSGLLGQGGLETIVAKFNQGGLSEVVHSWISTGANLPVSAAQIETILGSEQVTKLASGLGIDTSQLAQMLPGLIDKLTPNGQLPTGGITDILSQATSGGLNSGGLGDILGGLLKGR